MHAHGKYRLELKDNQIDLYLYGPFNKEGIENIIEEINTVIEKNSLKDWTLNKYLDENTLAPIEELEKIKAHHINLKTKSCKKINIFVKTLAQKSIYSNFLDKDDTIVLEDNSCNI